LDQAGGPHAHRGYGARHQVALAMWPARGLRLPPGWSAGDDALGRPYGLRRRLAGRGERSRLEVPGPTWIRDLETALPASRGRPPAQGGLARGPRGGWAGGRARGGGPRRGGGGGEGGGGRR